MRPSLLLSLLALQLGCSGDLPKPRYTPQVTAALSPVGYPAPPARVEFIPRSPRRDAVWLDGEWAWTGSKWAWTRGRWVVPPPGARFSPWTTVRDEMGAVYFAPGTWKGPNGDAIPAPQALAVAHSTSGDVTSPDGDDQKTGPSLPASPSGPRATADGTHP